jgi:ankyrin repeat protein
MWRVRHRRGTGCRSIMRASAAACALLLSAGTARAQLSAESEQRVRGAQVVDAACGNRMDEARSLLGKRYPANGTSYQYDVSAMHCAALWGNVALLRDLQARGASAKISASETAMQPIHFAALGRQVHAVKVLVQLGADINSPSKAGTPLALAMDSAFGSVLPSGLRKQLRDMERRGQGFTRAPANDALIQQFVALGAKAETRNARGQSPLHIAAGEGDVALVRALLSRKLDPNALDQNGMTPLLVAVRSGTRNAGETRTQVVNLLLAAGAQVNARDAEGANAFCPALRHPETLEVLVRNGLDVNTVVKDGAFCWSTLRREMLPSEIIAMAAKIPKLRTPSHPDGTPARGPLYEFAYSTDVELVEYFVKRGLRPVDRTEDGSGVMHAVMRSSGGFDDHDAARARIALLLLDAGADVNLRNNRGETPIMEGVSQPAALIQFLIMRGANVNAVGAKGRSVLDEFTVRGKPEVVAVLRAAGARPGVELGETAGGRK